MATAAAAAAAQRVATAVAAATRLADSSKPVVRHPARRTAVARPVATARGGGPAETAAAPRETAGRGGMVPDGRERQARGGGGWGGRLRVGVARPTVGRHAWWNWWRRDSHRRSRHRWREYVDFGRR